MPLQRSGTWTAPAVEAMEARRPALSRSSSSIYRPTHVDVDSAMMDISLDDDAGMDDERNRPSREEATFRGKRPSTIFAINNDFQSVEHLCDDKPPEEDILLQGMLQKRCVGRRVTWVDRFVCLTKDRLCVANDGNGDIRDTIRLRDITKVQRKVTAAEVKTGGRYASFVQGASLKVLRASSDGSAGPENARPGHVDDDECCPSPLSPPLRAPINNTLAYHKDSAKSLVQASPGGAAPKNMHDHEWGHVLEILVAVWGRTYYLKASSEEECDNWISAIHNAREEREAEYHRQLHPTFFKRTSFKVRTFYEHPWTQAIIGVLLFVNFVFNLVETELLHSARPRPPPDATTSQLGARRAAESRGEEGGDDAHGSLQEMFDKIDVAFTLIYLLELGFNLYGRWWRAFFSSPWNIFDLLIVTFSVFEMLWVDLGLGPAGGSGPNVNLLRLLRVFRVLRIFNKLESMRKILDAMMHSFAPVLSAFLLSFVLVSIYAIVACNLFVGTYPHAQEYFGSYTLALISLLGIATGDSWTAEVRAMTNDDEHVDAVVCLYFMSYILLIGIIMINVIVSVLIESFMSSMGNEEEASRVAWEVENHHKVAGALDPLLATLANFSSPAHLNHQMELIFALWYFCLRTRKSTHTHV